MEARYKLEYIWQIQFDCLLSSYSVFRYTKKKKIILSFLIGNFGQYAWKYSFILKLNVFLILTFDIPITHKVSAYIC